MKMLYKIEVQRSNITPKAFFAYCARVMQEQGANMEDWAEYDAWASENQPTYRNEDQHEDWDEPCYEICSAGPYKMQLFLARAYNFILEFDFDTDKKGTGYLFALEFER